MEKKELQEVFQKIVDICEQHTDEEGTLDEIKIKAENRVIRYDWKERYGIDLDSGCRLAEHNYINLDDYQVICYFKDGYNDRKGGSGRYISWSEDDKQPVDEWLYNVSFPTGAYIFGEDYSEQEQLFQNFFEELRKYKPDYEDLHNHNLYWKIENAKEIISQFEDILEKYVGRNREELKTRRIAKLENELSKLRQ